MYKSTLRTKYRHIRSSIPAEERELARAAVTERVLALDEFINCDKLFTFISSNSEISTTGIILRALSLGKTVAAPLVTGKHDMCFIQISSLDELKNGSYNIPEPEYNEEKILTPSDKTLLLVPGFAFDGTLNRLGYGGGYYDKYMAENPSPFRVGIGFSVQYTKSLLPHDDYDVPLDILITEKEIIKGDRK